jgi:hypothetical protein
MRPKENWKKITKYNYQNNLTLKIKLKKKTLNKIRKKNTKHHYNE